MVIAVRFTWLGIFPLLLLAQAVSIGARAENAARVPAAIDGLLGLLGPALLASFVWIGPWPRISDVLRPRWEAYREPYAAEKYPVDAIWMIRDAGLEGRLFINYSMAGYAGFWLAPKVESFINGSLNVPPDTIGEFLAINRRRGVDRRTSFLELLDRSQLDLFLGTGMPGGTRYTASHLERVPGWIPIFRNARSALYLRAHSRQATNLRRVADYYAREGIPFDPSRGFDSGRVVREHTSWAIQHHMIPENFAALEWESAESDDSRAHLQASIETASFFELLGLYDEALEREARIQSLDPAAIGPRRRTVWCLLRAGRYDEARAQAERLARYAQRDPIAQAAVALARSLPALPNDVAESRIRRLPLVTASQAQALEDMLEAPRARVR
jgi:hypothetical protein